ncbi:scavenger receptor cysteine-rich type 1 protein M130 [Cyclopterus lumpus]|uniref:scavenger receptor cysteine-rich type 1 protein M130 n=1 Tax=Cyclopterus lumpus TaxID=8103 RepID=UPI0014864D7C|nr:scavenger receptor cysteine-rich type 1 protein M130 [Cyclopterus lumpus]
MMSSMNSLPKQHHIWTVRPAPHLDRTTSTTSGPYDQHHIWTVRPAPHLDRATSTTSGPYDQHHIWTVRPAPHLDRATSTTSGPYDQHHIWTVRPAPHLDRATSTTSGPCDQHHIWTVRPAPHLDRATSTTSGPYDQHHIWTVQPAPHLDRENRIFLKNGSSPCEGYIGIYHNGKLGFVGQKYRSNNTEKVVCSSTQCGEPVSSRVMTAPWPVDRVWLNEVKCTGDEPHLWKCTYPGWGVSLGRKDALQKIKCSHKIAIRLDGFTCAGAVQYSVDGGETNLGYLCADNWGKDEADLLCKNLNCGTSKEIVEHPWMGWKGFKEKKSKTMTIKCSGIKHFTHLWQCAVQITPLCRNPALVLCTGHERVQLQGNPSNVCSGRLLKEESGGWKSVTWTVHNNNTNLDAWCQKMQCGTSVDHKKHGDGTNLTCSDDVKVVLMDNNNNPSRCYGAVHVAVNGTRWPVCSSTWTNEDAKVVCSELGCGSVFSKSTRPKEWGIMDNVQCSGQESSLWHCRAKRDHSPFPCTKSTAAYVVCADSMKVRLMDGPGKCAGRVEIEHEGKSLRVYQQRWTDTNLDTVCELLNCGKKGNAINLDKFSQGSGEFLLKAVQCKKNAKHISECITSSYNNPRKQVMGITCEEHKVVFLKGNLSCLGMVGIEQGSKTYWLSGYNGTWNKESANTVCRQMHCGKALQHSFISRGDTMKPLWNESYRCSSNSESLFHCESNNTLPSDHPDTIATVICSGNITVDLTNECWGNVNVCLDGKCGGVCADSWTKQKSAMLCENLGCGNRVLEATAKPNESQVMFKSMHSTEETTHLFQCNFVISDENDKTCDHNPAYVVCSGSVKAKMNSSRDKCSGNVEVQYEGQLLPICINALTEKATQNTICGELNCGHAINRIGYFGSKATGSLAISQIQCSANNNSLAACTINFKDSTCSPGGLQCSGWRKMALTVNKACSGVPVVYSEGKISAISFEGWTKTEGERLCQDLECGNFKSVNTTTSDCLWTTNFSCADGEIPKNIWDCEKKVYLSHESQSKKQLFIECQDEPEVTLSEGCFGEVKINGIEVCDSHWKESDSQMVCEEQNCSNAIAVSRHGNKPIPNKEYHHVSCEDNHYTLGQCKRSMRKCSGRLVSVYCVGNVQFKTTERCGGQIVVNYQGTWEKVCPLKSFPAERLKMLCEELRCNGTNASIQSQNTGKPASLETMLNCKDSNQEMKYCLSNQPCEKVIPAEIYCDEYDVRPTNSPKESATPMWTTMVGVGFTLLLVTLIVTFIVICLVKSANKGQNVSRMLSRKEVEFESGAYDDVMSQSNEMEELNRGRFRSESEVVTENDAQSTFSLPYDDIEGPAVAQPLTSRAAAAPGNDGAPGQSAEGATYEVDDQQESYDDIEVSPEILQTEAEVHNST